VPAVGPVDYVVRLASRGGLIAAAGELARLVPQRHQPPQVVAYRGSTDYEQTGPGSANASLSLTRRSR
jgi:hypothetical protein